MRTSTIAPSVALLVLTLTLTAASAQQPATRRGEEPASREHRDKLVAQARQRMRQDREKYTQEQLTECENLYQMANKNWRTPEAATTLKVMIERYPDVNRTGCAALYLAQYARGEEQIAQLKVVIEQFSDCWYGNGAQVGALARFYLAGNFLRAGKSEEAKPLLDELGRDYPDAITHQGVLVAKLVKQQRGGKPAAATQPAGDAEPGR
jgi:hypothetical protein